MTKTATHSMLIRTMPLTIRCKLSQLTMVTIIIDVTICDSDTLAVVKLRKKIISLVKSAKIYSWIMTTESEWRLTNLAWSAGTIGCIHQLRTVPAGTVDVTVVWMAPNRGDSGFSEAPGIASNLSRTMCRAAADLSRGGGGRLNIVVHPDWQLAHRLTSALSSVVRRSTVTLRRHRFPHKLTADWQRTLCLVSSRPSAFPCPDC